MKTPSKLNSILLAGMAFYLSGCGRNVKIPDSINSQNCPSISFFTDNYGIRVAGALEEIPDEEIHQIICEKIKSWVLHVLEHGCNDCGMRSWFLHQKENDAIFESKINFEDRIFQKIFTPKGKSKNEYFSESEKRNQELYDQFVKFLQENPENKIAEIIFAAKDRFSNFGQKKDRCGSPLYDVDNRTYYTSKKMILENGDKIFQESRFDCTDKLATSVNECGKDIKYFGVENMSEFIGKWVAQTLKKNSDKILLPLGYKVVEK